MHLLCSVGGGGEGGEDDGDGGGDGDGSGDGDGGSGGEALRLISRVEYSPASPVVPRKISGAALSSPAVDEVAEVSSFAAAVLFLDRRAARWLTLEAARAILATFLGCAKFPFCPFKPAATELAVAFTLILLAGSATTSAKDLAAAGVLATVAGTFTASAGGAAL